MNHKFEASKIKLTLTMAAVLVFVYLAQPYISGLFNNNPNIGSAPMPDPAIATTGAAQTESTPLSTLPTGADPFKAHIEKNGLSSKSIVGNTVTSSSQESSSSAGNAAVKGADPFKAFLDQQKSQSKDAAISPFGK
jgi:hypothetical protein